MTVQFSNFSNYSRISTGEGGFESIGSASDRVVEGLRAKLRPVDIMITIPVAPDILAHIDHDALWSGIGRAELLRRCVTAAYTR